MGWIQGGHRIRRKLQQRWLGILVLVQFFMVLWWMNLSASWLSSTGKERAEHRLGTHIKEDTSTRKLPPGCAMDDCLPTNVRIEVIANNRLKPLERLLSSLKKADYMGASVPLDIHLEANEATSLLDMVVAFKWPYGQKQVHLRHSRGGLINAVLESWYPASMDEMVILLEDDIEVSPFFYRWVIHNLDSMKKARKIHPRVVGLSLYTPRVGELKLPRPRMNFTNAMLKSGQSAASAFHFQLPCSWGALYFPRFWRELRSYASLRQDPEFDTERFVIPGSRSTGWSSSWKKFAIELFWSRGYSLLYPNFPNQSSLSTNHLEPGEHIASSPLMHLPKDYTVPLLSDHRTVQEALQEIMDHGINSLPVFDLFGMPVLQWRNACNMLLRPPPPKKDAAVPHCSEKLRMRPCRQYSTRLNSHMSTSDKISIVIAHFWTEERASTLNELIQYYAKSPIVDKIFVVWHSTVIPCPANALFETVPVIFSCQTCDSLNNRFLVDMRLTTKAVLIMDDDVQIHLDDLERLFLAWQRNTDRIVGFFPRWFQPLTKSSGRYVQKVHMLPHSLGYSFMLTKAMMVDSGYVFQYRCGLGLQLHDLVDARMNGEDIAFNVMVGKLAQKVPALFVQPEWPLVDYGTYVGGGLHTRSKSHSSVRSQLLSKFMGLLNVTAWNLCCEDEILDVQRNSSTVHIFRQSFTKLSPYVYNPCKDQNSTSDCHFIPYSRLNRTGEATILLQS